jgi:hypothetical protein
MLLLPARLLWHLIGEANWRLASKGERPSLKQADKMVRGLDQRVGLLAQQFVVVGLRATAMVLLAVSVR